MASLQSHSVQQPQQPLLDAKQEHSFPDTEQQRSLSYTMHEQSPPYAIEAQPQPYPANEQQPALDTKQEQPLPNPTPLSLLGHDSTTVSCPSCRKDVLTRIHSERSEKATKWSIIICLCVGVCFAWIPLVIKDCKNTVHTCPSCNRPLATVDPDGAVMVSPHTSAALQGRGQGPYVATMEQMTAAPAKQ